jgi:hypothetical protein
VDNTTAVSRHEVNNGFIDLPFLKFIILHSHTNTQYFVMYGYIESNGFEIGVIRRRTDLLKQTLTSWSEPFLWLGDEQQDIYSQMRIDIEREIKMGIKSIDNLLANQNN